jgi:hypothetical protein
VKWKGMRRTRTFEVGDMFTIHDHPYIPDDTLCFIFEFDAESGWPVIRWTDIESVDRLTTINPIDFGLHFRYVV